jgi:ribonuclease J
VNEIGGNKILVEHEGSRLMLDFGSRMGFASEFFSDFLGVRSNTKLKDKLTIGILPKIPGIYRRDLIKPEGTDELVNNQYSKILSPGNEYFKVPGVVTYDEYFQKQSRGYLDGILISHAHFDHTGDLGFVHPDIPIFCSNVSKILIEAIDDITNFKSEAILSKDSKIGFTKTGAVPGSPKIEHKVQLHRKCEVIENRKSKRIGNFNITLLEVDHSVPGAASYIVECQVGSQPFRILYTGDVRFHGTMGTSIDDYITMVGTNIDLLLIEGTRIDSESKLTEVEVKEKISNEIRRTNGLVFVDFSWKDTTRYETIRLAAEAAGRMFVINARLAYILNKLGETPLPESVRVFLKRKGSCLYSPSDYSGYKHEFGFSVDKKSWTQDASHYENGVTAQDIKANPGKYVLMLSFYDLGQLFDLADENGKIPNSWFIKAVCAPFCDEMELDEERMINWLDTFGIGYKLGETRIPTGCSNEECDKLHNRIDRSHVSGHASKPEIKEIIDKIRPKTLIPIHTQNASEFEKIVNEINQKINIIIPKLGGSYDFK